ncbi:TlpA family protein disulfide reductase [Pedobacter ureilyticus]|uniref:TlpA family protein disulfide reductase n=1 Tax=Pedobacter ureilyticus TaxID=1393051 RepID=A0ABW9J8B3_9SPHI|nr:TlpA disulfide reductase family protein [Pedobacter helvus]
MRQLMRSKPTIYFFSFILFAFIINTANCFAQADPKNVFVIKGNVKNAETNFWELLITDFIKAKHLVGVPIDENGNFLKEIAISAPQDLYLSLNHRGIPIFAVPGDTLTVNWDATRFDETFQISAASSMSFRQAEINLSLKLYQSYWPKTLEMLRTVQSKELSGDEKMQQVQELFDKYCYLINKYPKSKYSAKIIADQYYFFLLRFIEKINAQERNKIAGTFKQYRLNLDSLKDAGLKSQCREDLLNEDIFVLSPNYRNYIENRVRFNTLFSEVNLLNRVQENKEFNFTLSNGYAGLSNLYLSDMIRDWYLTNSIINGYSDYGYEKSEQAYQKFKNDILSKSYKDTLERFHNQMQRLRKGIQAPAFSLKNADGKNISLSDFRGKVVYIDFWGIYCNPCINEINQYAEKVHQKYSNVVFINICVDADEKAWQKTLKSLKLNGINLLAKGWTKNPVCQAYNVSGIPHHVLIDKNGKLIDNAAPDLGRLMEDNNVLDQLLKM